MKIKKSDIDKIIKEEFQRMLQKKQLTSKLAKINESIASMEAEDAKLNEVEAGGEEKVSSHAWTGEANGDVKYKPKFEKIGTHLKEDDEDGMSSEMNAEVEENPMGEFESKFAEIGKAIDAKLASEMGGSSAAADATGTEMPADSNDVDDDFEEVEVSDEDNDGEEKETDIDEYHEIVGGVGAEHGMTADDAMKHKEVKESVEEPLEGHSVAQEVAADDVNDNMEKDTHVKENKNNKGSLISEVKSTEKNIFTEGVDAAKKAKLMEEFNRMKKFAGLSKDEE